MKKRGLIFAFCLLFALTYSFKAKADIEAIQAVITALGDVVEGAKEKLEKAKSLYESGQQLASQVKKYADEAKATIEKGKQMYNSAKEKAEAIKAKATGLADAIKNRDIGALRGGLENMEFSSLKGTFDGSHDDDEMAEAVLDTLVRKKGKDSIATQKALSKAINEKNGLDMAGVYGKTTVLRQDLAKEKDDFQNPQSVDEAIELCQKVLLRSMERRNKIAEMEGTVAKFRHTRAMESVSGDYEEGNKNE